jgi:hypothetical protein
LDFEHRDKTGRSLYLYGTYDIAMTDDDTALIYDENSTGSQRG